MESNEQTELTKKQGQTHRWKQDDSWKGGRWEHGGIEQKGKRTHGHGQQCGECWGKAGIRGLNDNGK